MIIYGVSIFIVLTSAQEISDLLSDNYIDYINSQNLTWKAGRNFHKSIDVNNIQKLLGNLPDSRNTVKFLFRSYSNDETDIPKSFDARKQWSKCASITEIRDQGNCGSCWAVSAVAAMTDRICIHSDQTKQVTVSAEDLLSCCGEICGLGCSGGYASSAWLFWYTDGIVSGGDYRKSQGCKSYSIKPCYHGIDGDGAYKECGVSVSLTPKCSKVCDDKETNYTSEKTYGLLPYSLPADVKTIQKDILKNGPVQASFTMYLDFILYKSGVYIKTPKAISVGSHAVKIIGWGEYIDTANISVPYWLIANSWNEYFGENGFFKILRGKNHCGIESNIVAGLPKFSDKDHPTSGETSGHDFQRFALSLLTTLICFICCR